LGVVSGRIILGIAAVVAACFLGFFAPQAAGQTPPPPPAKPDKPPPPPPTSGGSTYTPPAVTHSPPATTSSRKPHVRKHPLKKAEPVVFSRTHAPRDVAVWASAPRRTFNPQAVSLSTESRTSPLFAKLFAGAALALALVLLGIAAIPDWIVVRSARASLVLAHWRVQIAATGVSALCAAAIVFLIGTSGL
jgi:hypothetical protein